jgi:two-component system, cell cycle response regulator
MIGMIIEGLKPGLHSNLIINPEREKMMDHLTIDQWIEKGKNLPVLSGSIARILSLTEGSESNVSQISDIIKRDISLSAAILRITNSAAFGMLRKVSTIDQAVMLLGFKSVRNIALGVGVFNMFPPQEKDFLSKLWQRSLVTGLAARELCALLGNTRKEDAFTMGLLHDIGLVAFYRYDKEKASAFLKKIEDNGRMRLVDEKDYLGIDHVELGRLLAEKWKLPEEIIHVMSHHHEEPASNASDKFNRNKLFEIIYLGSLAGDIFYFGTKMENINKFTDGCQRLLGISSDDADRLLKQIHPQLMEVAAYFDIAVGSGNTYEEILSIVNEEIVNITISNEAVMHHLTQAFNREREMASRLEEANKNLQILASKDSLTGLYNRQFLNELLVKEWSRSERYEYPLSIILIDVDNFKKINDTFGHQVGDIVLIEIAKVLAENTRNDDCLARYGGEEFILVLPQSDLRDSFIAADRYRMAVSELIIPLKNNQSLTMSISCGVATAYPGEKKGNINFLIENADKALYEAKRLGKDRVISCNGYSWEKDVYSIQGGFRA